MTQAQAIKLTRAIDGSPVASNFGVADIATPEAGEGEILVRVLALSLDPYLGAMMRGRHMSGPAPEVGDIISGQGVGEVIASHAKGFEPGQIVLGETGWATHAAMDAAKVFKMDAKGIEPSTMTGVAGMPGLTAYASAVKLAKAHEGDRVLVSSAGGPVGGTVGQIARIKGAAKVVGIAGGADKCSAVVANYGFDACIDYKADGWQDEIKAHFPDGITYYHDNVGGEVLDVALANLANYGRVVLCGLASVYQRADGVKPTGPYPGIFIIKRAQIMGLVVYDYLDQMGEYNLQAAEWIKSGQLRYMEDAVTGLADTPALFEKLMAGTNIGKTVAKLA